MGEPVKCVSDHIEDLADGTVIAPGQIRDDVDLSEPFNARLLGEGRIIQVPDDEEVGA